MRDGRTNEALAELAAQTRAIVADHGRDDLGARLAEMLDQIEAPAPRVVVAGDFKQGKSTLVNALAGGRVVPVDDDGSTGTTTEVIARTASPGDGGGARLVIGDAEKHLRADEVAAAISEPAAGTGDRWWSSRVVVPAPESTTPPPTTLVDLPGRHGAAGVPVLRAALPGIVAALYVSDASAELTRLELDGLEAVASGGLPVALVMPKIDFYPAWRKVAALDVEHIAARGLTVPVLPVSSTLHQRAAETADPELETEVGFGPLLAWLQGVSTTATTHAVASMVDDIRVALAAVRAPLEAARAGTDERGRTLVDLQDRADRLRPLTGDRARWRRVMIDGIADLEPEGEHLLQARLRAVQRDAEAAVAQGSPVDGWGRFSFWLAQRMVADVTAAFEELDGRASALSSATADAFEDDEATAVALAPLRPPAIDPTELVASTSALDRDRNEPSQRRRVRRSLGRIDTAGVLEGLAMVSLNPISLAAGVLISRRAVQGARARQVNDQRAAAVASIREYVEEADFVVRREWRAAVRRLERDLRDGYEELATSLVRSADRSLEAARSSGDDPDRAEWIDTELVRLARLDEAAVALVTDDG